MSDVLKAPKSIKDIILPNIRPPSRSRAEAKSATSRYGTDSGELRFRENKIKARFGALSSRYEYIHLDCHQIRVCLPSCADRGKTRS